MAKLWDKNDSGRNEELVRKVEAFTVGNDYLLDQQIIPYDVKASKVHARGLERIGILTEEESGQLQDALDEIYEQWERDSFTIKREDEDGHTAIENFLTRKLGSVGKKIHAGRSRNDQVVTALRLFERDRLERIWEQARELAGAFLEFAEVHRNLPMPGYTHTQRAMLSSVGLWAGSYAEKIIMSLEYLPGLYRNVNRCPLGTAAGFGVNLDLPRAFVADELGFDGPVIGSMTAQQTRGRLEAELLSGLMPLSETTAQFANDLVWYTTKEFDFFEVADELCTGSSIMPQKKNLDTAEIMRGRHAELEGQLTQLKHITRNLTSGYHRDLQLTKEPILKGLTSLEETLEMATLLIRHIVPKPDQLRSACTPEIFAVDRANDQVKEGATFRDAYRNVADQLDRLQEVDPDENLQSKTHLGAPGNPGIREIRKRLEQLTLK